MSQFQLEQELQSALRLDSSLNIGRQGPRKGVGNGSFLNSSRGGTNSSLSTSRLLAAGAGGADMPGPLRSRSQSATRLSPSRLLMGGGAAVRSLSSSRTTSPSRSVNECSSGSGSRCRTPNHRSVGSGGDRFIPNRTTTDMDAAHHSLVSYNKENAGSANGSEGPSSPSEGTLVEQQRRKNLTDLLMSDEAGPSKPSGAASNDRILSFRQKAPAADEAHINSQKVLYSTGKPKVPAAANQRAVASKADRILDAPNLLNDFYLNALDWSVNNHMAVALYEILYIWNAGDGSIVELFSKESIAQQEGNEATDDYISSVSWVKEGNILAVGDSTGTVELWDVKNSKLMRKMRGHESRVATLDWNAHILASGSRSGAVHLHDVRVANHHVGTLSGHSQEVCGMEWSPDQGRLLATGSNDNQVLLWDGRNQSQPVFTLTAHQAAVKAVSWCPWQPRTLATGGGTNCRHIKFWNSSTGNCLNSVDTGSQISGIVWNDEYREVLTSHGFSRFQLTLWKYPSMTKVADLKGHTERILLLMKSPDGSSVASAAGDETIRFWNIWPHKDKHVEKKTKNPVSLFNQHRIR